MVVSSVLRFAFTPRRLLCRGSYSYLKCVQSNHCSSTEISFNHLRSLRTDSPRCCWLPKTCSHHFCTQSDEPLTADEGKTIKTVDPAKDRRQPVPLEASFQYMESQAYKETYGSNPVWIQYRRNFKGAIAPKKTRKKCIRGGVISTGSPCPICRDEYLVVDYRNSKLLKQFISPITGDVYDSYVTGVCQVKHVDLLVAIRKAKDCGYITYEVPFRKYDYSEYYDPGH